MGVVTKSEVVVETRIAVEYKVGVEELGPAVGVEVYPRILVSLFSTLRLFEALSRTTLIRERHSWGEIAGAAYGGTALERWTDAVAPYFQASSAGDLSLVLRLQNLCIRCRPPPTSTVGKVAAVEVVRLSV